MKMSFKTLKLYENQFKGLMHENNKLNKINNNFEMTFNFSIEELTKLYLSGIIEIKSNKTKDLTKLKELIKTYGLDSAINLMRTY
jgi:hypothetical protein